MPAEFDQAIPLLTILWFFLLMITVLPTLLILLALPYAVLRLRSQPAEQPDGQIGLKAALYFFFSLGILFVLFGLSIISVDLVTGGNNLQQNLPWIDEQPGFQVNQAEEEFPNAWQRTGGALIATGLIFAIFHWVYLMGSTNTPRYPSAKRIFVGARVAVHGLVLLFGLTGLLINLFQKSENVNDEFTNSIIAILIVWVPSWVIHLSLLRVYSRLPDYIPPK